MTEETVTEKRGEAPPPTTLPAKEKPIIDLKEIFKSRRGGEGVGFWETLAYLDYQDRKEDREWRRRELEEKKKSSSPPSPEVETLKGELSSLKESVADLIETMRSQRASEAQKEFVKEINKGIKNEIMPTIQALEKRIDEITETSKMAPPEGTEARPSELAEATHALRDAIDKLGEKAGAKALSLDDVDKILGIMDKLKGHLPKEMAGEFDWRTTGITTAGEVATEFIKAYKEVAGSKEETYAEEEAPAKRNIIERQLLLYLQRKMKEGAATFNPYEAAEELGATPRQIMLALDALTKKGLWMPPSKGAKKRVQKRKTSSTEEKIEGVIEEGEIFRPA